jgi:hypothetical protein
MNQFADALVSQTPPLSRAAEDEIEQILSKRLDSLEGSLRWQVTQVYKALQDIPPLLGSVILQYRYGVRLQKLLSKRQPQQSRALAPQLGIAPYQFLIFSSPPADAVPPQKNMWPTL